jgi:hypothetical protein
MTKKLQFRFFVKQNKSHYTNRVQHTSCRQRPTALTLQKQTRAQK